MTVPNRLFLDKQPPASRRQKMMTVLTHIICLGMLLVLPEILTATGKPFQAVPQLRYGVYCTALVYILVFYINYYLIIDRSINRKDFTLRLVGYNLIVVAAAIALFWLISQWMQPYWDEAWRIRQAAKGVTTEAASHGKAHEPAWLGWLKFHFRDCVMLVLTIGLSVALKLSDTWVRMSRRQEQMLAARRQEELQNLKSQLNPHFLFNTLNTIYALIAADPERAQEAVHQLSGMLRYVLYDDRREVELSRELNFVENYVQLMALRLPSSLKFECHIDAGGEGELPVAPLIFIPLVENAFKHCNTGDSQAAISINIRAGQGRVVCEIANSVAPERSGSASSEGSGAARRNAVAPSAKDVENGASGIGLQNLRRRLHLIYGDTARLEALRAPQRNLFVARLEIPLSNPVEF